MKFAEAQSRYQALLANGFKIQTIEHFFTEVFVDSELSLEDKFNLIKGHGSLGNHEQYSLFMMYLKHCIKLNDMLQNPTDFFIQLQNNKKIFEGILLYIPSDRYDSSLKLLAFAMRWYKKLSANLRNIKLLPPIHKAIKGSDEMMLYLEDTFKIDQQITITELNLLIAWLEFFTLDNAPIFKSIEITRDLNDLELILALTKLLKYATVLKFQECHISELCLQKMAQVQSQMGDIYPIKNVFISKISLDKHCLGQLKNWLGEKFSILNLTIEEDGPCTLSGLKSDIAHCIPAGVVLSNYINAEKLNIDCELLLQYLRNGYKALTLHNCIKHGLSISDPNITEVTVSDFQIVRGMQENPSLLTFLASLPNLKFLTIKNKQLFAVELKQLLNNVRVSQFTWDAPINHAQLDLIIAELANNKTLTTLSLPQGNFNRTSLLKLAQALRDSNNSLAYLNLPENIDRPNELEIELKKNRQRPELQRDYEIAQTQIRQIISFASSTNANIPRESVSYFGHNLNDMWAAAGVAYDRCVKWMNHKCSRDFKISELMESLAIGYSYLLAQSQTSQRTELIWYSSRHFKLLQDLLPHIKNPQAQIIFYQNIYLFCKSYCQALLNTTAALDKKETTDDRYVMEYLMQCDNLQMVLMCIPSANNLFYREVNEMLFAILQRKLLVFVANVPPSDDISLLCKNIKVATDIRDLLSCVNNFLEDLTLKDQVRLQYWMNFNNNLEPRAAAIVKLYLARPNIHEIYNVRRNPTMGNSQQIISLEKLKPIPTLDLAPPATFVGKIDKGESEKIENHSESNSPLLPPPLVSTVQPNVPPFVSPPAPPVAAMSEIISTAQLLPKKDELDWLGLEEDVNHDVQNSNLNAAQSAPNSPYQEITFDETTVQSITLNIEDTPTTKNNELKSDSDEEQEVPINIRSALQFMTLGSNIALPPQPLTLPAAPTHDPNADEQKDQSQQSRREKTLAS